MTVQFTLEETINRKNIFWKTVTCVLLITICAFLIYFISLAPTVLWGDDAELQRFAVLKASNSGFRNYWLWSIIAHEFTKLPIGDIAWRVNLFCAVFASLTVGVVFIILFRILRYPVVVSIVVSIALAISHTFWLHAVRTEVYSFFLFILALVVGLLLMWHKNPNLWFLLCAGLVLFGLTFTVHLLATTFIPALIALLIGTKTKNSKMIYLIAILSVIIGLLPYWIVIQSVNDQSSIFKNVFGLLQLRLINIVLWPLFLCYQFILLTPIGILGLVNFWKSDRTLFLFLFLAFCGNVAFAIFWNVTDQYVFYLPSYLIFVLFIGKGLTVLYERFISWKFNFKVVMLMTIALLPAPIYKITPIILNKLDINLLSVRTLPYRDNNLFFLYPPKNGYYGARNFGETVMKILPPNAAILADWLPQQTLLYFQEIELMRKDILIAGTYIQEGQLAWLVEQSESRPVFMAYNDYHYDIKTIAQVFDIKPFGPIFILEKKL